MSGLGLFRLHPGFRRSSSSSDDEGSQRPPPSNPHRVKRALFGPTDHEENLRFVRKEMKKAKQEAQSKWNFDFDKEVPIPGGRFNWEEARASDLPAVYCERIPSLSSPTIDSSIETKENRVQTTTAVLPPPVSHNPTTTGSENPLSQPPLGSVDDLRTPQQGTVVLTTASSSTDAAENPHQPELGARPKEKNAKEKKLTEMFRTRKSRSKSASKLRLKRLGGGGESERSPSVKNRASDKPTLEAPIDKDKTEDNSGNNSDTHVV